MSGRDRPELRADVVLLTVRTGRLAVLLVPAGTPAGSRWELPGGPVGAADDLDAAARAALAARTGIEVASAGAAVTVGHLEQLRTYGPPARAGRTTVTVAYVGFVAASGPAPPGGEPGARFFSVDDLAVPGIGSDDGIALDPHDARVVADGVERARAKLEYTTLATAFLDEPFTLGELRRVYEAVWGEPLHEGNFRRKVVSTGGFVEPTGETAPTDGRPAALYRRGRATRLHPPILRA
jgi:8-oxo-dGTP diphosphatase